MVIWRSLLSQVVSRRISLDDQQESMRLFGDKDKILNLLRDAFAITLIARGNEIILSGEPLEVSHATRGFEGLRNQFKRGSQEGYLTTAAVQRFVDEAKGGVAPKTKKTIKRPY